MKRKGYCVSKCHLKVSARRGKMCVELADLVVPEAFQEELAISLTKVDKVRDIQVNLGHRIVLSPLSLPLWYAPSGHHKGLRKYQTARIESPRSRLRCHAVSHQTFEVWHFEFSCRTSVNMKQCEARELISQLEEDVDKVRSTATMHSGMTRWSRKVKERKKVLYQKIRLLINAKRVSVRVSLRGRNIWCWEAGEVERAEEGSY